MQVTVPYQYQDITIRHVAEHLMRFTLEGGIDILWDGLFFMEFKLNHHFNGDVTTSLLIFYYLDAEK